MNLKANVLWVFYFVFVLVVLVSHRGEALFDFAGPYGEGKIILWLIYLAFLGFSLYCHAKENFFSSVRKMWPFLWHRQIGTDLYIGLLVPLMLIFLNEGSLWVMLLWFVPVFIFANLATLLYLALNYQSLIAHFVP